MKTEQELDIRVKGGRKEGVFVMHFFCSGIAQSVSFVSTRDRQSDGEKVNMSCDRWKAEDSVLFFIYTPVFSSQFNKHK